MKKIELWEVKNQTDIKTKWGYLVDPLKVDILTKTNCFGVKSKLSYKQIKLRMAKEGIDANTLMIKLLNEDNAHFVDSSYANNIDGINFYSKGKCNYFWSIDDEKFTLPKEHKFLSYYFYKDKDKYKFLVKKDCKVTELSYDDTTSVNINQYCKAFHLYDDKFLLKYHLLEVDMIRVVNTKELEIFLKNEEVDTSRKEVVSSLIN